MSYEKLNLQEGDVLTAEHIAHIENAIETLSNAGSGSGETKIIDGTGMVIFDTGGVPDFQIEVLGSEFESIFNCTPQQLSDFLKSGGRLVIENLTHTIRNGSLSIDVPMKINFTCGMCADITEFIAIEYGVSLAEGDFVHIYKDAVVHISIYNVSIMPPEEPVLKIGFTYYMYA